MCGNNGKRRYYYYQVYFLVIDTGKESKESNAKHFVQIGDNFEGLWQLQYK